MPNIVWIWLAAFAVFLIIEIVMPSMMFIGFAIAAIISSIFAFIMPEAFYWQIGIFIGVSIVLLPLTKKMAKKITKESPSESNVDALIGKIGLVTKAIDRDLGGQVLLGGETWGAMAEEAIAENDKVEVLSIVGTRVNVKRKE